MFPVRMLVLLATLWSATAPGQSVRVYSDQGNSSHQQLTLALVHTLRQHGVRQRVSFSDQTELASTPREAPTAVQALTVTVGTEAALAAIEMPNRGPCLHSLIPNSTLKYLHAHYPAQRHAALVLDQPLPRRLALLRLALPGKRRLGALLGPWTQDLRPELEALADGGWSISTAQFDPEEGLRGQLIPLLARSDVLLAVPDPEVYNRGTIQNILLSTYRHRVPVMGFSRNSVRAGALLAVYSTPAQLGHQLGGLLVDYVRAGRMPAGVVHPRDFEVATNRQVARSLNIALESDDDLRASLRAVEESNSP